MANGNVDLQSALNAAKRTSTETPALIAVYQVSATKFGVFFRESPRFQRPTGQLVALFRNGQSVGA